MIIQIENIYYINCNMLYMYCMVFQKECLYNSLVIPNFKSRDFNCYFVLFKHIHLLLRATTQERRVTKEYKPDIRSHGKSRNVETFIVLHNLLHPLPTPCDSQTARYLLILAGQFFTINGKRRDFFFESFQEMTQFFQSTLYLKKLKLSVY